MHFLQAVTRARADGEHARIRQVEELTAGGQVIEERTEETFNEKTGVRRVVTTRRLTPGDWRGHFALLDRMDKLAAARTEPAQGGKGRLCAARTSCRKSGPRTRGRCRRPRSWVRR